MRVRPAPADEGMWTFDNLPVQALRDKYHFEPTKAWLDHLRLSSVRFNNGGSGSIVSAHGLVLTNHHVALHQLQNHSTAEHDYVHEGFYAQTPGDEIKSPDLEINVLQSMEDVTAKVEAASKPGMTEAAELNSRRALIAAIEEESLQKTQLKSEVVNLYDGGEYWLYRYKKYTDVRLVFAPELQIAFYGGDPDNFTFPRHCLDMAVFRIYENDKPIETPDHLVWSAHGPSGNDLVFVSGHPGSTRRAQTMTELRLARDVFDPMYREMMDSSLATLNAYAARGPDQARDVASEIYSVNNEMKADAGRDKGLHDPELMAKKQAEEDDLRAKVNANPEFKQEYGGAWDEVDQANRADAEHGRDKLVYHQAGTVLAWQATFIVQYATEVTKPDADRLQGYHEAGLQSLRFWLEADVPYHPELEIAKMTAALTMAQKHLPADDPWLAMVLDGKTPAEAAQCIAQSKMGDAEFRKQMLAGGVDAVNKSTDPLIVLARKLDPSDRAEELWHRTHVVSQRVHANRQLAKARFALYGKTKYPDATFTLRLSYGTVTGYPMNGTEAPWKTTMLGLYARSSEFDDTGDWALPPRWKQGRDKLDLSTPFNFVADTDIIGGNSGSPVVNRDGELVGLVFDGNIESLPGEYEYDGRCNRTVCVDSAAMTEALRKLYDAGKLADEIQSK